MKVFVVDDSTVIRERLKRLLGEAPQVQVVGEAAEARVALAAILDQRPDVVLLDIDILKGNSIDVLKRLKQEQAAPAVIILTDYPFPEYRQLCLDAGADFFLVKSTEFEQIVPTLQRLSQNLSKLAKEQRRPGTCNRGEDTGL
ncbi:MAG: response regulator transcription factor [Chloroflexi bacterium]|nr:response regulator transcription factor [Chloroflexota bacterium]